MKQIIEGKRYNTDTATLIGEAGGGNGRSDFNYWSACLYRTPRGAYFLAGCGHGNTQFATHFRDGMRGWGERIIPLPLDEALDWAERYLDAVAIEEHFGEQIADA